MPLHSYPKGKSYGIESLNWCTPCKLGANVLHWIQVYTEIKLPTALKQLHKIQGLSGMCSILVYLANSAAVRMQEVIIVSIGIPGTVVTR